jgi:UDP-N-acetylglucosamine acyltransferase
MMTGKIHPTAIISPGAKLEEDVEIGPYSFIGPRVELEKGVKLMSHVHLDGITSIGEDTTIFPFAVIGLSPQDLKYKGEETRVIVGKGNTIREYVTIHSGTAGGRSETTIGNNCLLMVGSHVAHDCLLGNSVVLANNATLGGHVILEDKVIVGGLSAIHQFVRVGKHAMIGGVSAVTEDIIPYASVSGDRARLLGINTRGLRRHNFKKEEIIALQEAFNLLFKSREGSFSTRLQRLEKDFQDQPRVLEIHHFLQENKIRPICTA